ncbi:MAG: J domain-containing protein [Planctomycetes bacterium]|nr:J domain-containing protein [Planctomycetota bacterium]
MSVNYYQILEVQSGATLEEIRSSFRRKVMEHHPDRNPRAREQAEENVRVIIEAYRALSDPDERRRHDSRVAAQSTTTSETMWDILRRQSEQPSVRSLLVLHELLEGNGAEAVEIYESLLRDYVHFDLLPFLSLKDYLDCKFLLAEEYERQGSLKLALEMYKEVYKEELELPRLRYFFDEVKIRLRNIYCKDLAKSVTPQQALGYYTEALEILRLDKPGKALVWKRMAQCHHKLGNLENARAALIEAFRHHPKLKGVQRICDKLGVTPAHCV